MATAKEIMDKIPQSLLDTPVEDIDIEMLAKEMTEWKDLAPYLGLKRAEIHEIAEDYACRFRLQKREALRKWKEKHGRAATYRSLITILCEEGRADLADLLKTFLLTPTRKQAKSVVSASSHCPLTCVMTDVFHDYLVDCYSSLPHPSSLQWPTTMTSNQTYVELNLLDVPVKQNDPSKYSTITLKYLFNVGNSKAKRKVILIEGVAGAGKTTLSWYAFREWAKGQLFEHFKLLIHVDLSNPSIHSATRLSDLIPYPSEKMRTNIAEAIVDNHGKGVCFWFDGCDEAPPSLWRSFLNRFISGSGGRAMLPNADIILTSRPGTPLNLTAALTGKVIIKGFLSLDRYFAACLPNNGAQLIEALKMKPELYSLCHLPLNASILAYIYDSVKDDLPTTRTGLFYPLIQNVIIRHVLLRSPHQRPDVTDFPACLPNDIHSFINKVSKLAFENFIRRRKVFDCKMLVKCGIDSKKLNDAFGFLRSCVRFTMYGPTEQFSFTHLSFQEFLAAFHISQMDEVKQAVAVKIVFDQNPNSPVLAFYAGLTKLAVDEARKIFLNILSKSFDTPDIVRALRLDEGQERVNLARDPRRQLLCLMNGLYEAQNQHLFNYIDLDSSAKECASSLERESYAFEIDKSEGESSLLKYVTILFSYLYLYPTDCLSLGYFVRHACSQTENRVYLDLSCAVLGETEIKALMQELSKPASSHNVYLNVNVIYFTTNSLHSLSTVFNSQSCLCGFETSSTLFLDKKLAMKSLVEGYARSNCRQLTLGDCSSQSLHYIILMLMCESLHVLSLPLSSDMFNMPGAMILFSEALKYNILGSLSLHDCCINDESLMLLGAAVCNENSLMTILKIDRNTYTEDGLTHFLMMLLERSPFQYLKVLSVDHYNDKHRQIVKQINIVRKRLPKFLEHNYPPLTVGCVSQLRSQNQEIQDRDKCYNALMRFDLAFQSPHH